MTNPPGDFYVYIHRRRDDGLLFYVGKGCVNREQIRYGGESDLPGHAI